MRRLAVAFLSGLIVVSASDAFAGMPRGAELSADEQAADETTGETRATGNAELIVKEFGIAGRASAIVLQPKQNAILFQGRASVTVGQERFEGDAVRCTLDFDHCNVESAAASEQAHAGAAATSPEN